MSATKEKMTNMNEGNVMKEIIIDDNGDMIDTQTKQKLFIGNRVGNKGYELTGTAVNDPHSGTRTLARAINAVEISDYVNKSIAELTNSAKDINDEANRDTAMEKIEKIKVNKDVVLTKDEAGRLIFRGGTTRL